MITLCGRAVLEEAEVGVQHASVGLEVGWARCLYQMLKAARVSSERDTAL